MRSVDISQIYPSIVEVTSGLLSLFLEVLGFSIVYATSCRLFWVPLLAGQLSSWSNEGNGLVWNFQGFVAGLPS